MTRDRFFALIGEIAYDLDQTNGEINQVCDNTSEHFDECGKIRTERMVSEDAEEMLVLLRRYVNQASQQAQRVAQVLRVEAAPIQIGLTISELTQRIVENHRKVRTQGEVA